MIKINIGANDYEYIKTNHNKDIELRIIKAFDEVKTLPKYERLFNYFYCKTNEVNKEKLEKLIIGNKKDLKEIICQVGKITMDKNDPFSRLYTNFITRKWATEFSEKLGVNVCPYCNRQYTFTLLCHGVRPEFDHFYPKSIYSYLSVSLFNLIPSCGICNSKKRALDTYDESNNDFYYPYEDEFGNDVFFQTYSYNDDFSYLTGLNMDFGIKLICKGEENTKLKNCKEQLKIELLYEQHKDYVFDIIRNAVINNSSRIDELLEQFPELFKSKSEIISTIFMSYMNNESWGKRPLSKLTHDIYEEFKIIQTLEEKSQK